MKPFTNPSGKRGINRSKCQLDNRDQILSFYYNLLIYNSYKKLIITQVANPDEYYLGQSHGILVSVPTHFNK